MFLKAASAQRLSSSDHWSLAPVAPVVLQLDSLQLFPDLWSAASLQIDVSQWCGWVQWRPSHCPPLLSVQSTVIGHTLQSDSTGTSNSNSGFIGKRTSVLEESLTFFVFSKLTLWDSTASLSCWTLCSLCWIIFWNFLSKCLCRKHYLINTKFKRTAFLIYKSFVTL